MYKSPSAEWNGKKLLRVRIKALGQGETANSRKIDLNKAVIKDREILLSFACAADFSVE